MSPSMPINIATPASAASSVASSPTSSSSSSSNGVYVPVHRRTASRPQRTLPIYTPAELIQIAQSPLVKQQSAATHAALHEQEDLAAIALSRRQQRTREYMQRQNNTSGAAVAPKNTVVVMGQAPTQAQARRRPVGRAAERNSNNYPRRTVVSNKFMDAASWRGQAPRHTMEVRPVSLVV
ncbi:hypothetical protein MVEN_00789100 [Mycena venus]|uniref:Uncharacterized protein n=1 Tax=Mycena venus TaxID=2733690 RepID=A0A8H6YIT2_9AGAR|nr:hypothetical protein MVEN_00789100 [Mycena venus]